MCVCMCIYYIYVTKSIAKNGKERNEIGCFYRNDKLLEFVYENIGKK